MRRRSYVVVLVALALLVSAAPQAQQGQQHQYPMMNMIAQKIIDKNGVWYLPTSGANGVVYTVVPAP